jgi:hypothetical protein
LFYTSGSSVYPSEHKFSLKNLSIKQKYGNQYLNKFHGYSSSSIITIPQQYFGEKIKEGSFVFTDKSFTNNDGNYPKIKDDGYGNLYSTNADHSQSAATSISSSDNYIGNIFYDFGLVVISETGSWSGSVNYSEMATNYNLEFKSTNAITTHEYNVKIQPREFNKSMNYTLRMPLSGTFNNVNDLTSSANLSNPWLATNFTSSNFAPYITTINLYNEKDKDTPAIIARLAKPIQKSKKLVTQFKIRLDL